MKAQVENTKLTDGQRASGKAASKLPSDNQQASCATDSQPIYVNWVANTQVADSHVPDKLSDKCPSDRQPTDKQLTGRSRQVADSQVTNSNPTG